MMKRLYTLVIVLALPFLMVAQTQSKLDIALRYLEENKAEFDLDKKDISDVLITDQYVTKHNGATHIYLNQTYNKTAVQNAVFKITLTKDNEVFRASNTFVSGIEKKVNASKPSVKADQALTKAFAHLGIAATKKLAIKETFGDNDFIFDTEGLTRNLVPANLKYVVQEDGSVKLTWNLTIDVAYSSDYWNLKIDAVSGEILDQFNHTIYCKFGHEHETHHKCNFADEVNMKKAQTVEEANKSAANSNSALLGGSYRVYPLPARDPTTGNHEVVSNVEFLEASPFGWHDYDGQPGADFTITRGNNAHASLDINNDGNPDPGREPDGGADLIFDFEHQVDMNSSSSYNASITNAFYLFNWIHDVAYLCGFDEASGNYQQINYTGEGNGNDEVFVLEAEVDASENASFQITADGLNGTMNLGEWTPRQSLLRILEPIDIAAVVDAETSGQDGSWGHNFAIDDIDVTADVALAFNSNPNPVNAAECCPLGDDIISDVEGKIALINRGGCNFTHKCFNAQEAGAVAAIVCNVPGADAPGSDGNTLIVMGAGADGVGVDVTIPSLFIGHDNCERIKLNLANDVNVSIRINQTTQAGPDTVSSAFDASVIYHEFGHGVSTRLVGGPSNAGSLTNGEQMGEGWSDIMSLMFSVRPGDNAETPRGIGTYLRRESADGPGIRAFRYSRDMSICPWTYEDRGGDIYTTGQIWTSVLWDMYWNFVDLYGYDADWTNTESGNFKAVQLILDGMRETRVLPGVMDGRDGIIAADMLTNDGEHECMLWETFARRGMGYYADQGSSDDRGDGSANFDPFPLCIKELKITKTTSELINAGDELEVTLDYANHTEANAEGITITDNFEDGLTYIAGSGTIEPTINGNTLVFDIGEMESLEEGSITYRMASDPDVRSESLVFDDIENGGVSNWQIDFSGAVGPNLFSPSVLDPYEGSFSWYVEAPESDTRQSLVFSNLNVTGEKPALRFWQKYNTKVGFDGGFVEISTDGVIYSRTDDFIRNGYNANIDYGTFVIPDLRGFSGTIDEYVDTYINLSDYIGQTIWVRYRFATNYTDNPNPNPAGTAGWLIDNFELMDLKIYEGEVCIEDAASNSACDTGSTIVNSIPVDNVSEANVEGFELGLFPNPADEFVTISLQTEQKGSYIINISDIQGKKVFESQMNINNQRESIEVNTKSLTSGMYILRLETDRGVISRKLVIE